MSEINSSEVKEGLNRAKETFSGYKEMVVTSFQKGDYSTNPAAENILNGLAKVVLWVGIILSGIVAIGGVCALLEEFLLGLLVIFGAFVLLGATLISWASLKVTINISRNLFNINASLKQRAE